MSKRVETCRTSLLKMRRLIAGRHDGWANGRGKGRRWIGKRRRDHHHGGKTLSRLPGGGTEKAVLGKMGIAKPRGTVLDAESLAKHVRGEDVNSGVTSWTTDREVAKRFAGSDGTIIEVEKSKVANQVVPRPPVPKYAGEKEVLLKGTIHGTPTIP